MTRARDLAAGTFEQATGGVLKLETSDTTVTDGSVLGKIEFKAPDEASGTDAILVGAAIEAVAEGTFAADNNATELVFKTGASAAADAKMTLTSGGDLLVGKSVTTFANNGIALKSSGETNITRNDGVPVYIRRNTSDGDIVQFWKDGSTVGSIGVNSSTRLYFTNDTGAGLFLNDGPQVEPMNNGSRADATMSLGGSTYRFKDLYLSGGVYLGGTGSANLLDDYEEGTWTPTLINGGTVSSTAGSVYTKIGNMVTYQMYMVMSGIPSNTTSFRIGGLPFAATTSGGEQLHGNSVITYINNVDATSYGSGLNHTSSYIYWHSKSSGAVLNNTSFTGVTQLILAGFYYTA
jgi:hypothetical protein